MIPGFRLPAQIKDSRKEWKRRAAVSADSAKQIAAKYDALEKKYQDAICDIRKCIEAYESKPIWIFFNRRVMSILRKYKA